MSRGLGHVAAAVLAAFHRRPRHIWKTSELCRSVYATDRIERVDLLIANQDHLVLMEFMRPGVAIDREHINRFTQYVDELRGRILASTSGQFRRITGTLVADRLEKSPGNSAAINRLAESGMFALEWKMLLANAERAYEEYFQIMKDRVPDDPRLEDLSASAAEKGKAPNEEE
jgi:hypothetical protein